MFKFRLRQFNQRLIRFWLILVWIILIGVVLEGVVLTKNQVLILDDLSQSMNLITESIKPKLKVTYVELPNAHKVVALVEDYKQDDSLWRIVSRMRPLNQQNYRPVIELAIVQSWSQKSNDERSIRSELQTPLRDMFTAARAAGYDLMIGSGFRSAQLQSIYYNNFVRNKGQAYADKVSARPGTSEHQLGLAVDLAYTNRNCYLSTCFAKTGAGKWLASEAHNYGFILRYPEGKEDITGYQYEPWHFRYVGLDLATALHESGLTLDEAEPFLLKARASLGYKD